MSTWGAKPVSDLLEVRGLRSGYGRIPILQGIDFSVARGEFVGLFGHNGMGKSTLMRTLAGQLRAAAGRIVFRDTDLTMAPAHQRARAGLGYIPQGRDIFPRLSVAENLWMGARMAGKSWEKVDEIVAAFPRLAPLRSRTAGVLSGGEQQILAIARCLCGEPSLILLDEPTEGIQPSIIDEIADHLLELKRTNSVTMILVEQSLDFIRKLSDRILVIQKGVLIRQVPKAEIGQFEHELIAEAVGAE
jgi:ABC-type branched-subunit amino acid transport system ATPase component